jgi:hypothetical protein
VPSIGFQKGKSILDAAIHMSLRRKVNGHVEPASKDFIDGRLVGNVATYEVISVILCNLHQDFDVTRVGKPVEVEEFDIAPGMQQIPYKLRTYKAGSAGDQDFHSDSSPKI